MNADTTIVLSSLIVVAGKWAKGEKLEMRIVVGGAVAAIFLTVLSEANPKFGQTMSLAVLVGATVAYGPDIAKKLGYSGALASSNKLRTAPR